MTNRLRPAVRGLIIDDLHHVLLVRLVFDHGAFWVLPGGGVHHGESLFDALRRELNEETGLSDFEVGAHVWNRVHEFSMVDTDGVEWNGQRESAFLVRTKRFVINPSLTEQQLHLENLREHKWWSIDDLASYVGSDQFAPRDLHTFVAQVLKNGPPTTPFEIHQVN